MASLLIKIAVVVLTILAALLFLPTDTSARTWHITPDGTGDAPTIQAGVDSAAMAIKPRRRPSSRPVRETPSLRPSPCYSGRELDAVGPPPAEPLSR